ncbi:MAG: DUF4340 domain-containing protein [Betaproteobacteria bacterium]|nr:DUF4340 domain-containing protein [Betaproteobacteria bacterium]
MNKKQFLGALGVLLALLVAGAGVLWMDRSSWQQTDARVGQQLVSGLKVAEIAEIRILQDAGGSVTLAKTDGDWRVRERADFAADANLIREFLLKFVEAKVVQTDPLPETQRARLQLQEPKGSTDKNSGTVLELKDAGTKSLARLLLGKKILKQSEGGPASGTPSGRYVLSADGKSLEALNDPLTQVELKPEAWLAKDFLKIERIRSMSAQGRDGKSRWKLTRGNENADWKFAGSAEKPDNSKVQDLVGSFYSMSLEDIATDPKDAGLDRATIVKVDTFDGISYQLSIGAKSGENRYFATVSVSGELIKVRQSEKGETPEQKEKQDKSFDERIAKLEQMLKRDSAFEKWTFILQKSSIDPLLRGRAQLLPEKKPAAKKS